MTLTEFSETRLLPLVLAFAGGVLVMDVAQDRRDFEALDIARRAVSVAEEYRAVCGPVPLPVELSAVDLERIAEARP